MKISSTVPLSLITENFIAEKKIRLWLLRLDLLHPEVSGNKWFKLKYNLEEASKQNQKTILTFGGPFSNHIAATAAACHLLGFKSIGIIRSFETETPTLLKAYQDGMQLHFVTKNEYVLKNEKSFHQHLKNLFGDFYLIPEGGDNDLGFKGTTEILQAIQPTTDFDFQKIRYIACAIGTGTTFGGIMQSAAAEQIGLGFTVFKNGNYMNDILETKIPSIKNHQLITDYHFGGFAKTNNELIQFMNSFYNLYQIKLDKVYTAKMMFGIFDLIKNNKIETGSQVLAIHTGGLQGN